MRFLILIVILFCGANSASAEFILKQGDRELIGVPVNISNTYIFVTCESARIGLSDGAVLTYVEDKYCELRRNENDAKPSGIRTNGEEFKFAPRPQNRYGGPSVYQYDNAPFRVLENAHIGLIVRGAQMSSGIDLKLDCVISRCAQLHQYSIVANMAKPHTFTWKPAPLLALTYSMARISDSDCRGNKTERCNKLMAGTTKPCPECKVVAETFIENNKYWEKFWWNPKSQEMAEYYANVAKARESSDDKKNRIIGDFLMLDSGNKAYHHGLVHNLAPDQERKMILYTQ